MSVFNVQVLVGSQYVHSEPDLSDEIVISHDKLHLNWGLTYLPRAVESSEFASPKPCKAYRPCALMARIAIRPSSATFAHTAIVSCFPRPSGPSKRALTGLSIPIDSHSEIAGNSLSTKTATATTPGPACARFSPRILSVRPSVTADGDRGRCAPIPRGSGGQPAHRKPFDISSLSVPGLVNNCELNDPSPGNFRPSMSMKTTQLLRQSN